MNIYEIEAGGADYTVLAATETEARALVASECDAEDDDMDVRLVPDEELDAKHLLDDGDPITLREVVAREGDYAHVIGCSEW